MIKSCKLSSTSWLKIEVNKVLYIVLNFFFALSNFAFELIAD